MPEYVTPNFQELTVGDELPVMVERPGAVQLFLFSAVTWDTHRTHFDAPYSVDVEALPGILVHGHLQGTFLGKLVSQWVSPGGRLASITYQNRGMSVPGDELSCHGRITAKREESGKGLVELEVWVEKQTGDITTTGQATAELPL